MKKRLFSIAAVLLLLLSAQTAAYAEMTYSAPEDVALGSELNYLVATVPAGSEVSAPGGTLPAGVELDIEETESPDMANVYLRGVPRSVGTYNCVVNIGSGDSSNLVIVPVTVVPETPAVTVGSSVHCYQNDSAHVSVTASVSSGSLTYQWYSNTVNSIAGSAPIPGADQPVYPVSTANVGTTYYYCSVTNTVEGTTRSVTSDFISVTVEAPAVTSISVETLPYKTVYTAGDQLDASGLSIRVNQANGSSNVLTDTSFFGLYPTQLNAAGVQNVEVGYQGLTCIFQVTVQPAEEVIDGIGVLTLPNRLNYTVGDVLDTSGLSLRVYTNNGYRDVSEDFTCDPMVFDMAGTQTVTVSYGGKTCTFALEIQEQEKPVSLLVSTLPAKREYKAGETLDTTGLVLQLITNRNNSQNLDTGFTCTPTVLESAGRQDITVSYVTEQNDTLTCIFSVNVLAAETSPPVESTTQPFTPVPSIQPTDSPVSTPHIIEHQSHNTGVNNALVVVIIVAAVLGLGCLGAYVFIMNRGGVEGISEEIRHLFHRSKGR